MATLSSRFIKEKDQDEIKRFLSRAQRMANTEFPEDIEGERVIFKGKGDGYGFIENMTKLEKVHFMEREAVYKTLRNINKSIMRAYSAKRQLEDKDLSVKYRTYGRILGLLLLIGLGLLIVSEVFEFDNDSSVLVAFSGVAFLAFGSFYAVWFGVAIMKDDIDVKDMNIEIHGIVDVHLNEYNRDRLGDGGLMKADPEIRWIEVYHPKKKNNISPSGQNQL